MKISSDFTSAAYYNSEFFMAANNMYPDQTLAGEWLIYCILETVMGILIYSEEPILAPLYFG